MASVALAGVPGPMDTDLDIGAADLPVPEQYPPGSTSISDVITCVPPPPADMAVAPADDHLFQSAKALVQHHFVHSPIMGTSPHSPELPAAAPCKSYHDVPLPRPAIYLC